jgi:phosphohistidine phosphatase
VVSQPRRLFLLRHAKSSWDDPDLADHDRPLARRGRRAAQLIAGHLRGEGISPSLVLCSSAKRTRETLELAAPGGEVKIERELYGATKDDLLDRLRRVPDTVESAMLIGHNPAVQEVALGLAAAGARLADVEQKYPTGALATLTFAGPWRELRWGGAELDGFVTPKEIERGAS